MMGLLEHTNASICGDSWVHNKSHGSLIPEWEDNSVVFVDELGVWVLDLVNLIQEILRGNDLVGNVTGNGNTWEVSSQGDFCGFRVNHKVDVRVDIGLVGGSSGLELSQ